jgi:hypothetical protein
MRSLPRGVRPPIRTRRSSGLSTRVTNPYRRGGRHDTDRARGEIHNRPYRIDRQRPLVQQDFQHAEIREAESGPFNIRGCVEADPIRLVSLTAIGTAKYACRLSSSQGLPDHPPTRMLPT